ncbi:MAG: hypothetical protein GOU98_03060 [Candidatus Altiarchaeota archaeon]|nr:hypothetical protein [Candidatus Altiarchaeota archaeon]
MDKFHKAKSLTEDNKVKYKGLIGSSLYFSVLSNSEHQVLFRIANHRWMCDCEWAALHKKDCSHILAAKQWLKMNESESIKTNEVQ